MTAPNWQNRTIWTGHHVWHEQRVRRDVCPHLQVTRALGRSPYPFVG